MTPAEAVAAVKDLAVALLPNSATPREKALLAAELARLALYDPSVIATIWDPWKCPAALLPWLAWALSVDVWDPAWPEATKRAVIAASPMVHRLKGTRAAVERALAALGLEVEIVEWWETEPVGRRGTFAVTVLATGGLYDGEAILDAKTQLLARDTIRRTKPKSRVFDYAVGVEVGAEQVFYGAVAISAPLVIDGILDTEILATVDLETVGAVSIAGVITIEGVAA